MPQPKAHRYKRDQRLLHAKSWIQEYKGKRIHHGYAKHFGVNKLCAIAELEILGVTIPTELKDSVIRAEENKRIQREKLKIKKEENFMESDYYFAYIAGYTSGGAPFGITWEEMDELGKSDDKANVLCKENDDRKDYSKEDELPF